MGMRNPPSEEALAAANEALEFRPNHVPALYRRSQAHLLLESYGDAVRDAKDAYYYAEEEVKFEMWKYRKHVYEQRRQNTLWWGLVGFVGDLPWTIAAFPWTFAAMKPRKQALTVMLLALSVGYYQLPKGSIKAAVFGPTGAVDDGAAAAASVDSPTLAGNASAGEVATGLGGAAGAVAANLSKEAAAELEAAAAKGAAFKAAESKEEKRRKAMAEKAAKSAAKQAEKEKKAAEKAAEKAAKEAAKAAAKQAAADAKAAKEAAKAAAKKAKETAPAVAKPAPKQVPAAASSAAVTDEASASDEEMDIQDVDTESW